MKKIVTFILTFTLTFSLFACTSESNSSLNSFDEFINQEFIDTMENDYIGMHQLLINPEDYGIDKDNVAITFGTYLDEESQKEATAKNKKIYDEFKTFDREDLTSSQQDIYDVYEYMSSISEQMSDEKFDYYAQIFESASGIHYQISTLLTDWELRNEEDVKDLILLVEDVLPYIDSCLEYLTIQEEKGLLIIDLDSVIDYCQGIVDKGEDSAILASMNETIEELGLDEALTKDYEKQLSDAFKSSFLVAYQNIIDKLNELKATNKDYTKGYASFEYGQEYYELLLQYNIGSYKSVDEVKEMIEEGYEQEMNNLTYLVIFESDSLEPLYEDEMPSTSFTSYEDILEANKEAIKDDFPEVSDLTYEIEEIDEEIASDSGVTAYFFIPALDGDETKRLRVNPDSDSIDSIRSYLTVSHEGLPGHMYQYAYMYENNDSLFTKGLANVLAYSEGYAKYAEYESLNYLDIDQPLLEAYKANEVLSYYTLILSDIGIHYEGWDLSEFTDYLSNNGFLLTEEEAQGQYMQLVANPAIFEPYYVGYYEIKNMKDEAMDKLGDNFSEKGFNEAILKSGEATFEVVQKYVDQYIEDNSTES